jgi:acyl carrier protein
MDSSPLPNLAQQLAEVLEIRPEALKAETRFVEDCGGASINLIIVVMMLEEMFDLEILDEEAETLASWKREIGHKTKPD